MKATRRHVCAIDISPAMAAAGGDEIWGSPLIEAGECNELAAKVYRRMHEVHMTEMANILAQMVYSPRPIEKRLEWDDLRGSAPNATGGLSSEDFVRRMRRDDWR
jgi:hypothetical protein